MKLVKPFNRDEIHLKLIEAVAATEDEQRTLGAPDHCRILRRAVIVHAMLPLIEELMKIEPCACDIKENDARSEFDQFNNPLYGW